MQHVLSGWFEASAQRKLSRLHTCFGVSGLAAAAALPGVAAMLDQHAAAVRDILTIGVDGGAEVPMVVLLAGYAAGLLSSASETGAEPQPPADRQGWARADWLTLRLASVCQQAQAVRPAGGTAVTG